MPRPTDYSLPSSHPDAAFRVRIKLNPINGVSESQCKWAENNREKAFKRLMNIFAVARSNKDDAWARDIIEAGKNIARTNHVADDWIKHGADLAKLWVFDHVPSQSPLINADGTWSSAPPTAPAQHRAVEQPTAFVDPDDVGDL
jgi:hypothetical protein